MPDGEDSPGLKCFYHLEYGLLHFDGSDRDLALELEIENTEIGHNIYCDVFNVQIKIYIRNSNQFIWYFSICYYQQIITIGNASGLWVHFRMLNSAKGIYLLQINS